MGSIKIQNRQDTQANSIQPEDWKLDREDLAATDRISSFEALQLATKVGESSGRL